MIKWSFAEANKATFSASLSAINIENNSKGERFSKDINIAGLFEYKLNGKSEYGAFFGGAIGYAKSGLCILGVTKKFEEIKQVSILADNDDTKKILIGPECIGSKWASHLDYNIAKDGMIAAFKNLNIITFNSSDEIFDFLLQNVTEVEVKLNYPDADYFINRVANENKDIISGDFYKHYRNEKIYQVLGYSKIQVRNHELDYASNKGNTEIKNKVWVDGILYMNVDGDSQMFVIPEGDFKGKFTKLVSAAELIIHNTI